jgi:hypothetical protein
MSDATGFAVSLPRNARLQEGDAARAEPIDLNATYRFSFVRQRWLTGIGVIVQGTLMGATGVFLLTQIPSTPSLVIQMAIVGTLLAVGGLFVLAKSWSDFFGGVTIDSQGFRASLGLSSFKVQWPAIARWRVNEIAAKMPELSSVEIWTGESDKFPRAVPGGRLNVHEHHRIRQLLHTFAEGREQA